MPKRVLVITERAQAKALAKSVRLQIVDRLVALGPLPARELAFVLSKKATSIYHHLAILESVGLVVAERSTTADRGRPSDTYRAIARRIQLGRPYFHPEIADIVGEIADQTAENAARSFRATMQLPSAKWTGARRRHGFFSVITAPSPERLKRINELLDELVELTWTPDEKAGHRMNFAWFLSPVDSEGSTKA